MDCKYQRGKIYKIVCNVTNDIYVGSTILTLNQRLSKHKCNYKRHLDGKDNFVTSFNIIKNNDYKIQLIELYSCTRKKELHERERYYIEQLNCINKCIPGRTDKEYRQDNKDKIKEYRELHKDERKQRDKQYYELHKDKIKQRKKQHYELNKDKINQKRKQKVKCVCGSVVRNDAIKRHERSKKHKAYVNQKKI